MHNAYDDSLASYDGLPFPLWLLPRSPSPFSLFLFCATVFLFGEDGTISFLGASAWGVASPLSPLPPPSPSLPLSLPSHALAISLLLACLSVYLYLVFSENLPYRESPGWRSRSPFSVCSSRDHRILPFTFSCAYTYICLLCKAVVLVAVVVR